MHLILPHFFLFSKLEMLEQFIFPPLRHHWRKQHWLQGLHSSLAQRWSNQISIDFGLNKNHLHTCIRRLRSWRLCCPCARGSRACRCFWFCRRKFSISSLHFYYLVHSHRLARPRMRTTMVRSWSPGLTLRATRWSWFKL